MSFASIGGSLIQFTDFEQFSKWLNEKGLFHVDLGLERIKKALADCGLATPPFPIIQVLGTNGKGSTCAFLESLSIANDIKTGLFTSPHFISVKERIKINKKIISDKILLSAINSIFSKTDPEVLTYFETLVVLATEIFKQQKVELAIFEAGLGGCHDATSALPAKIQCFTPIAMDHAEIIGPCIRDIASDKAKAIMYKGHVFSAPQFPAIRTILNELAYDRNAKIIFIKPDLSLRTGLSGAIQQTNASLALAAWSEFTRISHLRPVNHALGLASAFIAGRRQRVALPGKKQYVILDGAHNPHAIQALVREIRADAIIFSALADKDWRESLAMLCKLACPLHIPQLDNKRAENALAMTDFANTIRGGSALAYVNLQTALVNACTQGSNILICGSLYLLAEFYKLYPQFLEKEEK